MIASKYLSIHIYSSYKLFKKGEHPKSFGLVQKLQGPVDDISEIKISNRESEQRSSILGEVTVLTAHLSTIIEESVEHNSER